MNGFEIEQYMKSKEKFTVPEIQVQFHLTYREARSYFYDLQDTKEIVLKDGQFYYNFDLEELFDLYRNCLWECVIKNDYNKFVLRSKFQLTNEDFLDFEKWMQVHHYYDAATDEVLITKDEFIKRYGKKEEPKSDLTVENALKMLSKAESNLKKVTGLKKKIEAEDDEFDDDEDEDDDELENEDNDKFVDEEDNNSEDDEDDAVSEDEVDEFEDDEDASEEDEDDNTSSKKNKEMLYDLIHGHFIRKKEDFLTLAEAKISTGGEENSLFLDFLKSVVENIKNMTEIEFKAFIVRLLKNS